MDCARSADDLREQLRAEAMLAKLEVLEDLALMHDDERVPVLRLALADRYRRSIGVFPAQRQEFHEALMRVAQGRAQSISGIIEELRSRDHENGPMSGNV